MGRLTHPRTSAPRDYRVGKLAGGSALLLASALMAFVFLHSDVDAPQLTKMLTLLGTVGLPGIAGAALVLMELESRAERRRAERDREDGPAR
jgi:hypothetical protein